MALTRTEGNQRKEALKDVSLDPQLFTQQKKPMFDSTPTTKFYGWHRVDWHERRTVMKVLGGVLLLMLVVVAIVVLAIYITRRMESTTPVEMPSRINHTYTISNIVMKPHNATTTTTTITTTTVAPESKENTTTEKSSSTTTSAPPVTTQESTRPSTNKNLTDGEYVSELPGGHRIIYKPDWDGKEPAYAVLQYHPTPYVVISQTGGLPCDSLGECEETMRILQDIQVMQYDLPDVGVNFYIGGDGNVYVGRGWTVTNYHVGFARHRNIGIAFIGDYKFDVPTEGQLEAAQRLIELGVKEHLLDANYMVLANEQINRMTGPGIKLMEAINNWPHRCLQMCDTPRENIVEILVSFKDTNPLQEE